MVDEALLGLHASGVSSAQKHEACLRHMKRFAAVAAKHEAKPDGFIHHFCLFPKKAKMVEVAVSKSQNYCYQILSVDL